MSNFEPQPLKHADDWSFIYQYHGTPDNLPYLKEEDDGMLFAKLVSICGYLAVFSALLVTMAPIPIMIRIRRENSVGALPLLPFSSMTVNCFAWFTYGRYMIVSAVFMDFIYNFSHNTTKHENTGSLIAEPTIWVPNLITLPLTLSYVMQYIQHSRQKRVYLFFHLLLILVLIIFTTTLTLHVPISMSTQIIGIESMILAILRDCSSLLNVPDIIRNKCASPIPVTVTLASALNSLLWLIYGKANINDFKVYAPNLLRLLSNLFQLYLVQKYGFRKNSDFVESEGLPLMKIDKKMQE